MYDNNALTLIMLCSHLGNEEKLLKPYTAVQWSKLAKRIMASKLSEPASLLHLSKEELIDNLKIDDEEANRISELLSRGVNMALKLEELENKGIRVLTRSDKAYPMRLKKKLGNNAPPLFYYAGDLKLLKVKSAAIVGSRNIDESCGSIAKELAKKLTDNKLSIVSGGAKGVDIISEEAAVEVGGYIVSFVADSLEKKVKTKKIRDDILSGNRLLLTAQNPNSGFSVGYAMNRNKYIYALSSGAFVVSADYEKGGTWSGAIENMKKNWVPTYVFDNGNKGNSELIRMGGIAFTNVDEFDEHKFISYKYDDVKQIDLFSSAKVSESDGEYR